MHLPQCSTIKTSVTLNMPLVNQLDKAVYGFDITGKKITSTVRKILEQINDNTIDDAHQWWFLTKKERDEELKELFEGGLFD